MSRQLLHWRGGVHGTKALNPPPPVLSLGYLQQAEKTDSAGIEIPGLDTATTSSTFVHALKTASFANQARNGVIDGYEISLLTIIPKIVKISLSTATIPSQFKSAVVKSLLKKFSLKISKTID